MKIKKRYSVLLVPIILLVGALPSSALTWTQLLPLLQQVQGIKNDFMSLYENFDERLVSMISDYVGEGINVVMGELGIPDLKDLRKELRQEMRELTTLQFPEFAKEEERNAVRTKSMGTLSEEGQAQQKQKMDDISTNATSTLTQGVTAQFRPTTQQVMKDIALQNSEISSTLSLMGSEIMDMSQKQDLANLSLSNISESIDSQNLAYKSELDGSTRTVVELTGLIQAGFHNTIGEE